MKRSAGPAPEATALNCSSNAEHYRGADVGWHRLALVDSAYLIPNPSHGLALGVRAAAGVAPG